MTVLIVPSWYTAKPNAQLGAFFREQALALKRQGIDIIVADATLSSRETSKSEEIFKLKQIEDDGLKTYIYKTPSLGGWRVPRIGVALCYRNLKKIYKKIRSDGHHVDLIHAHAFFPAGVAAVKLGEKYQIPVVFTEHTSSIVSNQIDVHRIALLKECVAKAEGIICVGEALKREIVKYTNTSKDIYVIPNMVDQRFCFSKNAKTNEEFTFVSIGNLIDRKRFDLTIDAFARSFKGNDKVRLDIIGDGVLRTELEQKVKNLNIQSQVNFHGQLSRENVIRQLQSSDAFVLPSDFETFGVVYIEALACGVPVIGTRNGGADDIITEMDGYLVDKDNVCQLEAAMRDMYEKYNDFDKVKIADKCQKNYGEQAVSRQIINIYENVINRRK